MTVIEFYAGIVLLAAVLGGAFFSADRLRRHLLPDWVGPPGLLVSLLLAVFLVVSVSIALGVVGVFSGWTLLVVFGLLTLVTWLRVHPRPTGEDGPPSGTPIPSWGIVLAVLVVAATVGQWASFASYAFDEGITNFDSVWYHLPFSAEFARTGSVLSVYRPETVFVNWLYPLNSEVLHTVGMVTTGRDFPSLVINMGWLGLALLAAWVAGRPWGRSHLTTIAVCVALSAHTLVVREPGSAKNDIMAIALILSALAVLVNAAAAARPGQGRLGPGWPVAVAGLALGLAAGTKVTALPPAVLIALATVVAAAAGSRLRVAGAVLGGAVAGGGSWYLRNLIVAGNPLPQLRELGPLSLPGPDRLQEGRPDFTVFDYLGDGTVWSDFFLPGLDRALGPLWPLLFAVFVIGVLLVVARPPGPTVRLLALATLGSAAAYLFTPLSAAGEAGSPTAFGINLRFLSPALAAGLVLVPLAGPLRGRKATVVLGLILLVLFVFGSRMDALYGLSGRFFGLFVAVVFVLGPAIAWANRERISRIVGGRRPAAVIGAALGAATLLIAWPLGDHYFDSRYRDFEPELGMAEPYRWADSTRDESIALAGTTAGFRGYGFFGPELDNTVRYVGRDAPRGGFDVISECAAFRREVNRTGARYLVVSPFLEFDPTGPPDDPNEAKWLFERDGLQRVAGRPPVVVYELGGPLDPSLCRGRPDLRLEPPGLVSP